MLNRPLSRVARVATTAAISFIASNTLAQLAADPNAIELRQYITVLDTAKPDRSVTPIYNIGDVDEDYFDDILTTVSVTDDTGRTTTKLLEQRLTSNSIVGVDTLDGFSPVLVADWDGDGRKDIFEIESPGGFWRYWFHRGSMNPPYFVAMKQIFVRNDVRPRVVADLNGDGLPDMIGDNAQKIYIYMGRLLKADTLAPSDSIAIHNGQYNYLVGTYVGQFKPGGKKQLLIITSSNEGTSSKGDWAWSITARLYPPLDGATTLWTSTPEVVYTDTVLKSVFVYTAPIAVGDFSGDGLDDFLIGDSAHVYVFKGGATFGESLRRNEDADLMLSSPHQLAPTKYRPMTYPETIDFLGDISGTHTPYIAVGASTNQDSVGNFTTYFYAGGSALDPYYDATLTWPGWYNSRLTPLHSGGVPALLFTMQTNAGPELDLLREHLSDLPHTQRSGVQRHAPSTQALVIAAEPNGNFRVTLPEGATQLRAYNTIGSLIEVDPPSTNEFELRASTWPRGIYTVIAEGKLRAVARIVR